MADDYDLDRVRQRRLGTRLTTGRTWGTPSAPRRGAGLLGDGRLAATSSRGPGRPGSRRRRPSSRSGPRSSATPTSTRRAACVMTSPSTPSASAAATGWRCSNASSRRRSRSTASSSNGSTAVRQSLGACGAAPLTIASAASHAAQHRRRQPARERVLLARVVRAEERVRPDRASAPCPNRGSRPPPDGRSAASARSAASQPNAPEGDDDPDLGRAAPARAPGTARRCRAPRSSACWPAARIGRPPRCTRRSASGRRRRAATTAGRPGPRHGAPRTGSRPSVAGERRGPVRLPPCAAGASPTIRIRAVGSPNPGSGRPQYVSSRNRATFSRATRSRHSTSRGHRRHSTISAVSAARAPPGPSRARPPGLLEQELVEPPRRDRPARRCPSRVRYATLTSRTRRDRPDRQRADEVHALVQRRELDEVCSASG